ncbi:hypothetical protein R6Q59_035204 [Mikania micrantha]
METWMAVTLEFRLRRASRNRSEGNVMLTAMEEEIGSDPWALRADRVIPNNPGSFDQSCQRFNLVLPVFQVSKKHKISAFKRFRLLSDRELDAFNTPMS